MYGFFLLFRCSISSFSKLLLIKNIFILGFPNLLSYWQLLHKVLSNFFFFWSVEGGEEGGVEGIGIAVTITIMRGIHQLHKRKKVVTS